MQTRTGWLCAATMLAFGLFESVPAPAQTPSPEDQATLPLRPGTMPTFGPTPGFNPDGTIALSLPPLSTADSVRNRYRPEFDPIGLRFGSFLALPAISAAANYNTNVLSAGTNPKSDWAFELAPELRLVSDFPRHQLNLLLQSRSLFYNRLTSEDTTDFTAAADGRLDVMRDTNIAMNGGYDILHEARGSVDLPGNAAKPTEYSEGHVLAMLNHAFNRVLFSVGASFARFSFQDTELTPPGPTRLDNHDRDRDVYGALAQGAVEVSPGTALLLRGTYNDRVYDLKSDRNGLRRDSSGYEVDAGAQFELTRLFVGEIYAGYLNQNYKDPGFSDASGLAFGGQFEWYPTLLTTVRFNARRSIEETILIGDSSYTDSRVGVGVDHELLRNLILSVDASFEHDRFNGASRGDDVWGLSFTAGYRINRNIEFDAGYTFSQRDSNASGIGFSGNLLRIGIVGRL